MALPYIPQSQQLSVKLETIIIISHPDTHAHTQTYTLSSQMLKASPVGLSFCLCFKATKLFIDPFSLRRSFKSKLGTSKYPFSVLKNFFETLFLFGNFLGFPLVGYRPTSTESILLFFSCVHRSARTRFVTENTKNVIAYSTRTAEGIGYLNGYIMILRPLPNFRWFCRWAQRSCGGGGGGRVAETMYVTTGRDIVVWVRRLQALNESSGGFLESNSVCIPAYSFRLELSKRSLRRAVSSTRGGWWWREGWFTDSWDFSVMESDRLSVR